uniref:HAT C-terminal dimerisation domain-containing protein n=1 Tax=Romanomermis culicivorax TaxID=13658 RepID=A0A915J9J7_ROMCU
MILMFIGSKDISELSLQAKGLKKLVCHYKFVLSLVLFKDILNPLNRLALRLQSDVLHPFDIDDIVKCSLSLLEDQFLGEKITGGMAYEDFQKNENDWCDLIKAGTKTEETTDLVLKKTKEIVAKLITAVEERLETENTVLALFKIFKPLPEMETFNAEERNEFGVVQLTALAQHYTVFNLNHGELINEWQEYKRYILFKMLDKTWKEVSIQCCKSRDMYPNLFKLAACLLSFNAQNAIVERCFR